MEINDGKPGMVPRVRQELCSACGICVYDCPKGALSISKPLASGDILVYSELSAPEKCNGCGICAKRCPINALEMLQPAWQSNEQPSGELPK